MNKQISAAWKPLAAIGLALALAGCGNKSAGGVGGTTATGGTGDTLATVGGTPIMRADLNKILEAQSGEQVLPVLIDTQLLIQAGKDAGITVSDAEVAEELARQKKIDPTLEATLTQNPMLTDAINTQVRRNLVTQKLLTKDVKLSDDQLQKFFTTYKSYYERPAKVKVGTLLTSTKARADAMSRALKAKTKTFDALLAEQQKSSDTIAKSSSAGTDFAPVDTLGAVYGEAEAKSITSLSKGGTAEPKEIKIRPNQPPIYVLFHITDKQEPTKADFAALKPQIETDYKMAQVAMEEVGKKTDPPNPPFAETLKRTSAAVQAQQQKQQQQQMMQQMQENPMAPPPPTPPIEAPSLRDVLTVILLPKQQNLLTDLRAKGTVKIDDSNYSKVAEKYKVVPTPVPPAPGAPAGSADANAAPAVGADANAAPAAQAPAANSAAPDAQAPATNAAPVPATP